MSTPHNQAQMGDIAKTVLMPGDPLRAQFIAETFLENPVQFNSVRNMFGYTGTYKGKKISVMGSGMGIPSIGIYSHELYSFYGVENIIRIGSAGAFSEELQLFDTVIVSSAYSDSTFAKCKFGDESVIQEPSEELNQQLRDAAERLGIKTYEGRIWSSDVFYYEENVMPLVAQTAAKYNLLAAEMESFGLFATAKVLGKKAACILTISDSIVNHTETTAEERRSSLTNMIKIALEAAGEE